MRITKLTGLALLPLFAMILAGCGGGSNPKPQPKENVSITIALEDGKQFNENEFVAPAVSVTPSSITPTITYYKGETSLGETAPQTVGDYKITVSTVETSEYYAGLASKSFLIRKVPTLTFYYGNDQLLDEGHQFKVGETYNIYAKSSVEGATITYSYMTADGTAVNGKPVEAGVYYIEASVARTSTIGSKSQSIRYEIVEGTKENPTISFFYKGQPACTESNWLVGGYADSQWYANEFSISDVAYTITPAEATYSESWTLNDAPISKPSDPLAPGTYALTISVTESSVSYAKETWAGFVIKNSQKVEPTISFTYKGQPACTESNWIISGYADSQFEASEFDVGDLAYSVTPSDAQYTVTWKLNDEPMANAPTNPLAAGTYALTIDVTESATVQKATKWALFAIKETSQQKVTPTISFTYKGQPACTQSNWIITGYADSQFFPSEFNLSDLSYTVTPSNAPVTVSWTRDEQPIEPPSGTLVPGTYAMTVSVAASDAFNEASAWAGFVIKNAVKVTPTISFFYKGNPACTQSNWIITGYADSQFDAASFNVSDLTYTVTPNFPATVSWTLNENPIDAPTGTLKSGTYAMTVTVPEGDNNNQEIQWALFVIK